MFIFPNISLFSYNIYGSWLSKCVCVCVLLLHNNYHKLTHLEAWNNIQLLARFRRSGGLGSVLCLEFHKAEIKGRDPIWGLWARVCFQSHLGCQKFLVVVELRSLLPCGLSAVPCSWLLEATHKSVIMHGILTLGMSLIPISVTSWRKLLAFKGFVWLG